MQVGNPRARLRSGMDDVPMRLDWLLCMFVHEHTDPDTFELTVSREEIDELHRAAERNGVKTYAEYVALWRTKRRELNAGGVRYEGGIEHEYL